MVQIGHLQVLLESKQVHANNEVVNIGSRAFSILETLIRSRGELVSKDELMRRVWPDTVVEENNLQVHIATLRRVLGKDRRLIRTVTGRGYILVQAQLAATCPTPKDPCMPSVLAIDSSTLIGRQSAVNELSGMLLNKRIVTLVGAGGIGKTRLAAEVAGRLSSVFTAGVVFVPLASVLDGRFVLDALAAGLGIRESAGRMSMAHLVEETVGKRVLVILDNCEHVIDSAAEIAEALTSNCRDVCVLATSREALRTRGETIYRVPPLETLTEENSRQELLLNNSVQLFLTRAWAVDASFPSDDRTVSLVSRVCRRLDGIPLAIELAGARAATLGIEVLAEHLDDRFRILGGGYRTALPRHQTLKATFDWSYRLLLEIERVLFRRLGVFVNGFTFDAAFRMLTAYQYTQAEVLNALSGLVAKSLVVHDSANPTRYHLLESARAYALQQMDDNGERKAASLSHAEYFRDLFNQIRTAWNEQSTEHLIETFKTEAGNLRTALDWAFANRGSIELGIALYVAAVPYLFELSLVNRGAESATAALRAVQKLPTDLPLAGW